MRVVACSASDVGTGRLRVASARPGTWLVLECEGGVCFSGEASPVSWSDANVATADVLVWRGSEGGVSWGESGLSVVSCTVLGEGELDELEMEGSASVWRGSAEVRLWATQAARAVMAGRVVPGGEGWRVEGGAVLGEMRVVRGGGGGRVTANTRVRVRPASHAMVSGTGEERDRWEDWKRQRRDWQRLRDAEEEEEKKKEE